MAPRKAVRWDEMDKDSTPLEKLVVQFDAFNRSEGKTAYTVRWYNNCLGLFLDYVKGAGIAPVLGSINIEVVREYILHLQKRVRYQGHNFKKEPEGQLSPTSIQCYVRTIKTFFNWLHSEGYTKESRLERLKTPRAPQKLIDPLSQEETALVLSTLDPQASWGARDFAIVVLALDTGLRLSELVGADMKDLHLEEGYVKVMGKGQKERIVPFGGSAQKALMKYIYHFRPEPVSEEKVFLHLDGTPMTPLALQLVLRRAAHASGVGRLHAHLLRHTFAVNYLMNGGDVFTLQQILGHTTLEMVRHYVNLASAHVMTQHKRFSPVDRMNLRQVNRAITLRTINRRSGRLKGSNA